MKNKLKLLKENMKFNVNSNQFRLILLLILCFNLYGTAYLATNLTYLDGMINIITNGYYVVSLIGLVLLNTINTFDKFEKNDFYILRFKDRKMYLKQLIINVLMSNTILLVMNLVVLIIGLNLFASSKFVISNFLDYSIPNIVYIIFYLLRLFFIIQIIAIINVCLLKIINNKFVIGINLILYLAILFTPYEPKRVVSSISNMFLSISDYMRLHYYSNFSLEIFCSVIYIFIPLVISFILFNFTKNKMKNIGA